MNDTVLPTERVLSVAVPCFDEAPSVKEILDRMLESPLVGEVIGAR